MRASLCEHGDNLEAEMALVLPFAMILVKRSLKSKEKFIDLQGAV